MFKTGLVSISFRKETVEAIIKEVKRGGLDGIEWGGDIHVPVGNFEEAKRVGKLTREAGLEVFAYGSYYRINGENNTEEMKKLLESAKALGAPVIRVWAGTEGSAGTTPQKRGEIVNEAKILGKMADNYKLDIALECHGGTLTDNWRSSLDFLNEIDCPRIKMYWQPNQKYDFEYNKKTAAVLAEHTVHLHVFHWDANGKYPLHEGTEIWREYLDIFAATGNEHALLLEFMHDDKFESLYETAQTLKGWVKI